MPRRRSSGRVAENVRKCEALLDLASVGRAVARCALWIKASEGWRIHLDDGYKIVSHASTTIAFRLAKGDQESASELVNGQDGQRTSSHSMNSVFRRRGLLAEIPHVRLNRGVVIVCTEDAGTGLELLVEMGWGACLEGWADE